MLILNGCLNMVKLGCLSAKIMTKGLVCIAVRQLQSFNKDNAQVVGAF